MTPSPASQHPVARRTSATIWLACKRSFFPSFPSYSPVTVKNWESTDPQFPSFPVTIETGTGGGGSWCFGAKTNPPVFPPLPSQWSSVNFAQLGTGTVGLLSCSIMSDTADECPVSCSITAEQIANGKIWELFLHLPLNFHLQGFRNDHRN